ncbi:sedoheptulokinase [Boleophthalmus pectinirostris]|uniref:sedoheptulokinase n=1 Tax=Boleophthalmus pectinirostris TaxID=150288 RepID=UPI00242D7E1F|nr:sedoheptulokinase [Boleophthalmus pectinirostris]
MSTYILGIDLGTTSIKVVLLESGTRDVVASYSMQTSSDIVDSSGIKANEQDTGRIIDTLNQCIQKLPADKLKNVTRIGLSGQMHGVLFWKARSGCDWSRRNCFIAKDTSQLITWQDRRSDNDFISTLPKPNSHLTLATGFGCVTIFWLLRHRPKFLEEFTSAGTIQDYVVSMLCGLERCVMTPQNAGSWGYFNTSTNQWNLEILEAAGFPTHLLPQCIPSGALAGHTCMDWHGISVGTPVGAALGDFQCSVYSCMNTSTDAVLNISTSAQLSYAMPLGFTPPSSTQSSSPISYVPYFDSSYLAVAASLNGGNIVALFVDMLMKWMSELGAEIPKSSLYEKLIGCALTQDTSDLTVLPTVLGERHSPLCLGQVTHISPSNLSLGHVTRALCHGIISNLTSMMPVAYLHQAGVTRVVGSGTALARNQVLRQEVERAFSQMTIEYGQNADSAVGVAMVLCDRL